MTIAAALLAGYLIALFGLTLLAFPQPGASPNLTPLLAIARDLRIGGRNLTVNVLGNLAAFAPLGFLAPIVRRSLASAPRVALLGAGLSLLIESLQYLSGRRVADVDDVVLNTLGTLLGYGAFLAMRRMGQPRADAGE